MANSSSADSSCKISDAAMVEPSLVSATRPGEWKTGTSWWTCGVAAMVVSFAILLIGCADSEKEEDRQQYVRCRAAVAEHVKAKSAAAPMMAYVCDGNRAGFIQKYGAEP